MKNINEQLGGDEFSNMQLENGKTVEEEVVVLRDESAGIIHNLREQRDFKNESANELESEAKKTSTVLLGYLRDVKDPEHPNSLLSQAKENKQKAEEIDLESRKQLKKQKDFISQRKQELIKTVVQLRIFNPLRKVSSLLYSRESLDPETEQQALDQGVNALNTVSAQDLSNALNSHLRTLNNSTLSRDTVSTLSYLQDGIKEAEKAHYKKTLYKGLFDKIKRKIEDSLIQVLEVNPNFFDQNGGQALSLLKSIEPIEVGKNIVKVLDSSVSDEVLIELFNGDYSDLETIDILLKFGSEKMKKIVEDDIQAYVSENRGNIHRLVGKQPELPYARDLILHKVGDHLSTQYNIKDGFSLVKRWETSTSLSIETNLSTLKHLENLKPGAVKLLHEEYGICEFGRYPFEMLVDQADGHGKDAPYGVLIYPSYDHNDAFDHNDRVLRQLYDGTKGKHLNRIFEIESRTDFARVLVGINLKYKDKIDYMVFAAHGSKSGVTFGYGFKQGCLSIDLLEDSQSLDKVRKMFSSHPQIVLFSCSTGKEAGIAQFVSNKLQATVTAPAVDTYPTDLRVRYEGDKPKFDVTYDALPEEHLVYNTGTKS